MSNVSRSMFVFGIYLVLAGLTFMVIPNTALPVFGFAQTNDIWIRVFALLAAIVGVYYLYAVRYNDITFFRISVVGRLLFVSGLFLFFLLGMIGTQVIPLILTDLSGAAWTAFALRQAS
jgi:uncharacterized protein YjeT (DUF2065 family)